MPTIKKKVVFDTYAKKFHFKRPNIALPETYINGLPDLFGHLKEKRENFNWFKK